MSRSTPRKRLQHMELAISPSPSTGRFPVREFQKQVAKHVYKKGMELHTIKSHDFREIIQFIDGHQAYRIPNSNDLNGWILEEVRKEVELYNEDLKESWKSTGCSILLDGWEYGTGRHLISFLVSSPRGTIYVRSIDISSSDNDAIQESFEQILVDIGVENVVQIMSHSTSPVMKELGKILVDKYQTFFWTVNSSYCIELMLEKLATMDLVEDVMEKAKTICRFIHGNGSVLKLLRDRTLVQGLVKPSIIRSVVPYLTLQNMIHDRASLEKLFRSKAWKSSSWASTEKGKLVSELVTDHSFWQGVILVVNAFLPLVRILEWMNGDDNHLGNIYETIDQVKEAIRENLKDTTLDHKPFWDVIDDVWNEHLHSPLHAMGYFLNPFMFFAGDFSSHPEVTTGVLCCSARFSKDLEALRQFSKQLDEYQKGSGAFKNGIEDLRNHTSPVTWWLQHGEEYPELQQFAIRVLSQTCNGASKYCLERKMAEKLYSVERNDTDQHRQTILTFVHYNLYLQNFDSDVAKEISIHDMDGIQDWIVDKTQHTASSSRALIRMELD